MSLWNGWLPSLSQKQKAVNEAALQIEPVARRLLIAPPEGVTATRWAAYARARLRGPVREYLAQRQRVARSTTHLDACLFEEILRRLVEQFPYPGAAPRQASRHLPRQAA